jgi:hypothetical protein
MGRSISRTISIRAVQQRCEEIRKDSPGTFAVFRHIKPHRCEPVRESLRLFPGDSKLAFEIREAELKGLWRRVVSRCEPPISESGDTTKARSRTPAPDPNRWARPLRRCGLQDEAFSRAKITVEVHAIGVEECAERARRLFEAPLAIVELKTDRSVVTR